MSAVLPDGFRQTPGFLFFSEQKRTFFH